jgi:hypothetical protein
MIWHVWVLTPEKEDATASVERQSPCVGVLHTSDTPSKTTFLTPVVADLDGFRLLPNGSQLCPTTQDDQDQTALPALLRVIYKLWVFQDGKTNLQAHHVFENTCRWRCYVSPSPPVTPRNDISGLIPMAHEKDRTGMGDIQKSVTPSLSGKAGTTLLVKRRHRLCCDCAIGQAQLSHEKRTPEP